MKLKYNTDSNSLARYSYNFPHHISWPVQHHDNDNDDNGDNDRIHLSLMSSPPDSSMDDMLARATLQNYGDIGIVTIPGIEILSESEQIVAVKKAGYGPRQTRVIT